MEIVDISKDEGTKHAEQTDHNNRERFVFQFDGLASIMPI